MDARRWTPKPSPRKTHVIFSAKRTRSRRRERSHWMIGGNTTEQRGLYQQLILLLTNWKTSNLAHRLGCSLIQVHVSRVNTHYMITLSSIHFTIEYTCTVLNYGLQIVGSKRYFVRCLMCTSFLHIATMYVGSSWYHVECLILLSFVRCLRCLITLPFLANLDQVVIV